jgi:hypothetical protein
VRASQAVSRINKLRVINTDSGTESLLSANRLSITNFEIAGSAYRVAMPGHHGFRIASLGWSQRLYAAMRTVARPLTSPAAKSQQKGFPEGHPNPAALPDSGGSILHRLLQDVVEEPFGVAVLRSPFRTERRPLLYLSQGREQHAV